MFFCQLKEDIKVKRESFIKGSFREKASPSLMAIKNKEKERDFWLVLGLLTIMDLSLLTSQPLWQCCLSSG